MATASIWAISTTTPPGVSFGPVSIGASVARAWTSAHRDIRAHNRGEEKGTGEGPTLDRRRGAILSGLISERIDLVRLLLLLGGLIITRADLFLSDLLGFR